MSETRTRYVATYSYPGTLFPEETSRDMDRPDLASAVRGQPNEKGFFCKGGWYAVQITLIEERRFLAANGEEKWVAFRTERLASWVVGEEFDHTEVEDTPENAILISNIKANGGAGVKTRCGNWQLRRDYDQVVSASFVERLERLEETR